MKKLISVLLVLSLLALLPACAETVRVTGLMGPTGMGLAHMMAQNDGTYEFTLRSAPENLTGDIISGNTDIAAVPTNLAAVLYNKTSGGIRVLALNTLGVLYILENGNEIQSAADLSGKTIVAAGQGSTPEYILQYILQAQGVQDVTIEWRSEHSEVTALAAAGKADIVLLPEPQVTALQSKAPQFRVALDLTEEFSAASALAGNEDALLTQGCYVVRTEYLESHPDEVQQFMADCAASSAFVNENPEQAAQEIFECGILTSAAIAQSAIPGCHIVFIAGEEMRKSLTPLLEIFHAMNPQSVGGSLPGDELYYLP